MILHNILSAEYAEPPPSTAMVLVVDATLDGERSTFGFAYRPEDNFGLSPDINAWFASNPEFVPEPYTPAPAPDPLMLPVTKRQAILALVTGAGLEDPDASIETAINSIADPTARGLARADWRYAPQFWRNHALFNDPGMMSAMNLTAQDIDGLWLLALTKPA